jgi:hypothetical protein
MNGTAPSLERLATAYGLTRQGITDLSKRHGIDRETLQRPDALLVVLLDRGNRSPLRSKLTDPATRAAIASQIQTIKPNDQS